MTESLYIGCEEIMDKLRNDMLRNHIARTLGPSPFDFRGKHLMSREDAEKTADEVVAAMEKAPDKGATIMKALCTPEDDWND